jgi:hypothetical protein
MVIAQDCAGGDAMASLAESPRPVFARDEPFFMTAAILMALVLAAGFSLHLAMGRSSFGAPWPVHLHALLFFGWTGLYLVQNALVATGNVAVHRRLGWIAVVMIPAMVAMGSWLTIMMVRRAATPFFFEPAYFLVMNPLDVGTFAGLAVAAIMMRRRTAWHRRLMFCSMAMLLGPGFGRLLPKPLFIPWAPWVIFGAVMLFPIAGVVRDKRRSGAVHPAWWWGIGAMLLAQVSISLISHSAIGLAVYRAVTDGTPGAALAPLAYPPPPGA